MRHWQCLLLLLCTPFLMMVESVGPLLNDGWTPVAKSQVVQLPQGVNNDHQVQQQHPPEPQLERKDEQLSEEKEEKEEQAHENPQKETVAEDRIEVDSGDLSEEEEEEDVKTSTESVPVTHPHPSASPTVTPKEEEEKEPLIVYPEGAYPNNRQQQAEQQQNVPTGPVLQQPQPFGPPIQQPQPQLPPPRRGPPPYPLHQRRPPPPNLQRTNQPDFPPQQQPPNAIPQQQGPLQPPPPNVGPPQPPPAVGPPPPRPRPRPEQQQQQQQQQQLQQQQQQQPGPAGEPVESPSVISSLGSSLSNLGADIKCKAEDLAADVRLKDKDYTQRQIDCVLGKGPCDPTGAAIKRMAPDIMRGLCPEPCNQCTKKQIQKIMATMSQKYPFEWHQMIKQFTGR